MSQGFIGEKLGSFRLEEVLGSGAMGVVYRGDRTRRPGRPAAVKIVSASSPRRARSSSGSSARPRSSSSSATPTSSGSWPGAGSRGRPTSRWSSSRASPWRRSSRSAGELPWREVVELAIQICDALHYAHEHGVVHRDLKPSNLMITERRQAQADRLRDRQGPGRRPQLTATGRTLGTAAYMAPEQIRGTPAVSHKTDLYALGVVLYQMLTGKAPFDGASAVVLMHCHLNEPPPRPSDKVERSPRSWTTWSSS